MTISTRGSRRRDVDPLSPEGTVELLNLIKQGDRSALNRLLERCVPPLRRWAHGRLPQSARGMLETADIVQDAVVSAMGRLDAFEPRYQGALHAYLRQAVLNRIRDIVRQHERRPVHVDLPEQLESEQPAPDAEAIRSENLERYEAALQTLTAAEREAIILRIELQYSYAEIAVILGKQTADAARMTVTRATRRLAEQMQPRAPLL